MATLSRCPFCGATLHSNGASSADPAKCWMCTAPLPSSAPRKRSGNETIVIDPTASRSRPGARVGDVVPGALTPTLVLPGHEVIRLSVVSGAQPGAHFDLLRPLMTIGRLGGGADIEIDDSEVSRLHCSVEVRRDAVVLQDLRSKNGTFVADTRVFSARLERHAQFRVGATILQIDSVSP